ncbi:MAG: bifunctional adenosylcobinamide kinase/adenosylcobinamide-phosphate guanylyltransferase [Nitrospinota bacterium]
MISVKTLVTGGARSGKSEYALTLAESLPGDNAMYFVATAQALDDDMKTRIENHQKRRGNNWKTVEEPVELAETLSRLDDTKNLLLIDCLTLWTSNLQSRDENGFGDAVSKLAAGITLFSGSLIIVTNEVGMGIVPASADTRLYRDRLGAVNRSVAEACGDVVLMVSGIPIQIKGDGK